ncbi:hypothetical protein ABZ319_08600 [Nocardia sp. NPDC005978]|uniref:hypothetical protein n=1 Tax=Nocardia sp. NPDC005978 TaxID=3156725 RepID=UPI0033AA40A8
MPVISVAIVVETCRAAGFAVEEKADDTTVDSVVAVVCSTFGADTSSHAAAVTVAAAVSMTIITRVPAAMSLAIGKPLALTLSRGIAEVRDVTFWIAERDVLTMTEAMTLLCADSVVAERIGSTTRDTAFAKVADGEVDSIGSAVSARVAALIFVAGVGIARAVLAGTVIAQAVSKGMHTPSRKTESAAVRSAIDVALINTWPRT